MIDLLDMIVIDEGAEDIENIDTFFHRHEKTCKSGDWQELEGLYNIQYNKDASCHVLARDCTNI